MQVSTKTQYVLGVLEPKWFLLRTFPFCLDATETQADVLQQHSTELSGVCLGTFRKIPRFEGAACEFWMRNRRNQKDFHY